MARTWRTIRDMVPGFNDHYRDNEDWATVLRSTGHFTHVHHDEVQHVVAMSPERFTSLWQSHNHLAHTAGPQRFAQLINEIRNDLESQGIEQVPVPYLCDLVMHFTLVRRRAIVCLVWARRFHRT